jgi:NADPH2:quinone reductase
VRAAVVDRLMQPEELEVREWPEPVPGPGQLLVAVRAAGCNFFDLLMLQGKYQVKPELPFVPGAEIGGEVAALGEGVTQFRVGDRVFGACGLGGFAERALLPAKAAWRLPDELSFAEGAALQITYPTSYAALVDRARLAPGESLLVHAAAGGVGIAAVQIGKALGARVIATAGGAEKLAVAREHGADEAIDYEREDFAARVLELTGGRGADVIYDPVGGDVFERSLKCIAWEGRLLVIGFASGRIPELRLNRVLLKQISILGLHWGAMAARDPARAAAIFDALFALHAAGRIRPLVSCRHPLAQVGRALVELGARRTTGKVVVEP